MTEKSAAELERDADIARARVADTADSIRSKMTPGQLIDEFTGMFSGEGSAMLSNLKAQVRDNPLPLTLVGAGLAWLMLGKGTSLDSSAPGAYRSGRPSGGSRNFSDRQSFGEGWQESSSEYYGAESEAAGGGSMLSDAADSVASVAGGAIEAVADLASGAREKLRSTGGQVASGVSDAAAQARESALDLFQREPLAMAAVGLAVGTAIGVMLPHTATEDEQLGRYSDQLRESAEVVLENGMEQAKQVAAEAYKTVKEEADRQGASGDETLVDRIGEVAKKTASKTEEAIRDRLPETDEPPKTSS
ncbi:hypothetical protein [Mesorhizobium sp. M0408]|uniref:hypothetical protein n=1 Tax=Mesorhizobium sp. M0408 TaxID=2956942 RepID=UPI003337BB16